MDPFDLERFVIAQESEYEDVLSELRAGRKTSHWIWFIFPQMLGLGSSSMSRRYGITSLAEAKAYLDHPILGARLIACTELVNAVSGRPIEWIFGDLDAMKFRSSMSLFAEAGPDKKVFQEALDKYFGSGS